MSRYKLSKRKMEFAKLYFDVDRRYFRSPGNAYRCALAVGYSESYARRIMWKFNWVKLAWLAQKQGLVLDESTSEYVQRKISDNDNK